MASDFYDGMAEETLAKIKRMQQYVNLAIANGDAAFQEKPGEVKIIIRVKKVEKGKDNG